MEHEEIYRARLRSAKHREHLLRTQSFPRYLWCSFRESRLYQRMLAVWVGFRRYRLISRIITVVATVLTVMGTGAATLILSLLCLLILPIAALLLGGTMLLGFFFREHQNRILRMETRAHTVYLFFPAELNECSFSADTMRILSQAADSTVFVVSPYTWSSRGLGGTGFYINARRESEHLFLLRRHYFFFFRRLLKHQSSQRIVVIL